MEVEACIKKNWKRCHLAKTAKNIDLMYTVIQSIHQTKHHHKFIK